MKPNLVQQGITYGIITGLIFVVVSFGAWSVGDANSFVSITGIANFIPYVFVILIIAGIKLRQQSDNKLSFQEALKFTFCAYVVYALIEAISNYMLFAVIDKDLTARVMEISMQKALKMMEKFGATQQQIDDAIKKIQDEPKVTSFKQVFLGTGVSLIWDFVKSLLLSLIIRREPKMEDQFN